jgi:hypothetical protein
LPILNDIRSSSTMGCRHQRWACQGNPGQ